MAKAQLEFSEETINYLRKEAFISAHWSPECVKSFRVYSCVPNFFAIIIYIPQYNKKVNRMFIVMNVGF